MSPATAAFAEVLLRGVALCAQAVAVGGVAFAFWVLRGGTAPEPALGSLRRRALGLMAAAAGGLALVQACLLVLHLAVLGADGPWPIREVAETTYFRAGVARMAGAAGLAGAAWAMRAGGVRPGGAAALAALSGVIAIGSAWISHASARLEHGESLLAMNALHQVAASVWLGGLVHLTAAAVGRHGDPWPAGVIRRFSGLALSSVALLMATGLGLSALYYRES
jgi:putative copper export protein